MVLTPEHNPTKPKGKSSLRSNELRPTRKGVKPLSNHTFFLDIKKHELSAKIESKIQQFGGNISLFLVDEVTHVITDNIATDVSVSSSSNLQTTLSSSFHNLSNSLEASPSPCASKQATFSSTRRTGPRSRADAMLERAQCNRNTSHSPIQVARSRDIPVWNVEKILRHLNKITSASVLEGKLDANIECTKLLGPYLKVESLKEDFRPSYKYFRSWPALNLLGEFGTCPFRVSKSLLDNSMRDKEAIIDFVNHTNCSGIERIADSNQTTLTPCMELKKMARKTRQRTRRKESQSPQCGYCEICHVDYPDLSSHLRSGMHQNYVNQETNFISLDKLIQSEANVESFLKSNSLNINKRCLRSQDVMEKKSYDESLDQSELIGEANPEIYTKSNDAKCNDHHNKRCLRSLFNKSQDLNSKSNCNDSFDNLESSIGTEIEKSVDKVNLSTRCLRSQDYTNVKNSCDLNKNNDSFTKPKEKTPDINSSRLRSRVQLNIPNYNESFLEKNTSDLKLGSNSKDSSVRRNSIKPGIPISSTYKIIGPKSQMKEQELKSDNKNAGLVVKFKRIRQSELLVLSDEAENFMFPKRDDSSESESENCDNKNDANSKTNDVEMLYNEETNKLANDNSDSDTNEDNLKLSEIRNKQRFPLNPTQPQTSVGDGVGLIRDFTVDDVDQLKFSFECPNNDLWCHTYKRKDENNEMRFESHAIGITNKKFKLPYEMGPLPPLKPNCCKLNIWPDAPMPEKKIKKRKRNIMANGKSRKSPREHASTLASMVQQRQQEEMNALAVIKEENCPTDSNEVTERIHQLDILLSASYDDKMFVDLNDVLEEGVPIDLKNEPSINNLLESLDNSKILKDLTIPDPEDENFPDSLRNDIRSEDISKFTFSFECPPNELWYHTYKRKDENKELKFLNSKFRGFSRKYKLPYELGPLPPLKPNCCKLNTSNGSSAVGKRRMKKRKNGCLLNSKNCRKSPREHASLLASLAKFHKKQETNVNSIEEEQTESNHRQNKNSDAGENAQDLDFLLNDIYEDKTYFDVKDVLEEGISLNIRYEPTVDNLIETLDESMALQDLKFHTQVKHDRRKKRKKNRTGWPKKKKFLPRTTSSNQSSHNNNLRKDSFVNAATQTSTCELTNDEIVLSIPVTDDSVNVVELSSEPLVVCGDHSCSSGKENILCDNSDIFVECMIKSSNSINNDNEQNNKSDNISLEEQHNTSPSDVNKMITLGKCNINKIVSKNVCTVDDPSVVSDDRRFQPYVCVHKIDNPNNSKQHLQAENKKKRTNSKSVPTICTLSPRKLRAPRGKWYRER